MSITKNEESILVFTYKSTNTLIQFGGSQSWVLNEKRARKAKYIVCARNCHHQLSEDEKGHGSGFFVGKISGLIPAFSNQDQKRWMIEFSEFAEIEIPNMWQGWRNPVVYLPTNELGISFDELNFKEAPLRNEEFIFQHLAHEDKVEGRVISQISSSVDRADDEGISIQEAKKLLSKRYDVEFDNIEIILKG